MHTDAVAAILTVIRDADITVWIDGGWGIDALVGRETRPHKDLDLIVSAADSSRLHAVLAERGYRVIAGVPSGGVYENGLGARVDISTVTFDDRGRAHRFTSTGGQENCPADAFAGTGHINGMAVRCLSVEAQINAHRGYEPDDKDRHDVALLCEHFGIGLPAEYR